jgi:arginyl-tRNA synthetase
MASWDDFVQQVSEAAGVPPAKLEQPPKSAAGGADLSSSVSFELARQRKMAPFKIAEELIAGISLANYSLIEKIENKGGYLNFFAKRGEIFSGTVSEVLAKGENYGKNSSFSGNVLVEFPSVNPNKPWHIGHARNAVLGDTLSRVLIAGGYSVTKMDYIDDLGLQVAKVYWGTENLRKPDGSKNDNFLGLLYVDVEAKANEDLKVEEGVRGIMHEMEKGVEPTAGNVRFLAESCVRAQYETAYRLGVYHDALIFESNIVSSGLFSKALEKMFETGCVKKEEGGDKAGCIVCDLSEFPEFANVTDARVVLVRSDGTATYTAKDVAFQMWKFGLFSNPFKFKEFASQPNGVVAKASAKEGDAYSPPAAKMVINVIGAEQAHPQRTVYNILRKMGFSSEEERSFHLAYEHVWLPEGKFSGRKGTWVGYSVDNVLDEAVSRALAEVEKRNPEMPEEEKMKTAEAIGTAAVRYVLVKYAPEKKITFAWEEALSFDGNAAPYLQYALARCKRILEKSSGKPDASETSDLHEDEYTLAREIAAFPSEITRVAGSLKKEIWGTRTELVRLSEYSYGLATLLSRFYTTCRVVGSEHEGRRLALVEATYWALKNSLSLLGIPEVGRM